MSKPSAPAAPPPATAGAGSIANRSPRSSLVTAIPLSIQSGPTKRPDRIVLYGPGGVGKTTLAAYLPAPLFIDCEEGTDRINVSRVRARTWTELRGMLATIAQSPPPGVRSIVVDSATKAEEFACEHVISTRTTESGKSASSIESFGWGKGYQFVFEEFCALFADLDRCVDAGLNVCLIAHEVTSPVPNPAGEDWIRWEPHLYSGDKKGRGSVRARAKQWADHMLFLSYDVHVEGGKGAGGGTRTIYTSETPTHIAKSRAADVTVPFRLDSPSDIWTKLSIS